MVNNYNNGKDLEKFCKENNLGVIEYRPGTSVIPYWTVYRWLKPTGKEEGWWGCRGDDLDEAVKNMNEMEKVQKVVDQQKTHG